VCVNPRRGARSRKIPVSNLYSKRPDAGIALMAVAASTGEHQKRKERPEGRPISSQTKSRELLTRAHLRGDPRDGRVAGPHEPCRPANARPRRQRGPYSRLPLRRQLSGRPKAFPLLVPFARALAMPAAMRSWMRRRADLAPPLRSAGLKGCQSVATINHRRRITAAERIRRLRSAVSGIGPADRNREPRRPAAP
jgi:hypothetical protein